MTLFSYLVSYIERFRGSPRPDIVKPQSHRRPLPSSRLPPPLIAVDEGVEYLTRREMRRQIPLRPQIYERPQQCAKPSTFLTHQPRYTRTPTVSSSPPGPPILSQRRGQINVGVPVRALVTEADDLLWLASLYHDEKAMVGVRVSYKPLGPRCAQNVYLNIS